MKYPDGRDAKGTVQRVPRKDLPLLWSRGGPPLSTWMFTSLEALQTLHL